MTAQTATPSIAHQVDEFNTGFTAAIGDDLSAVFADEQAALVEAGVPRHAVSVGDTVPDAALVTPDGTVTDLGAVLDGAPAVLVFYRGAWCPYCNITLRTYQAELLPALRERGIALVAISPQTPDASATAVTNGDLDFPVLSDPATALIRKLGLRTEPTADARAAHTRLGFDVADSNVDATADIPFPTVLVVGPDRGVVFADVHVDYTTRTEVTDILTALDLLA